VVECPLSAKKDGYYTYSSGGEHLNLVMPPPPLPTTLLSARRGEEGRVVDERKHQAQKHGGEWE